MIQLFKDDITKYTFKQVGIVVSDWFMLLSNLQNSIFDSCICLASDKREQINHPLVVFF